MPQASAYLSDGSGSLDPDDAGKPDGSKPETWPLILPSAVPEDNRSPCYKGIVETERTLRLAQLEDNLVDLRRFRRTYRSLRLYFKKNTAGEGVKTQTKSRTIETGVNNRITSERCGGIASRTVHFLNWTRPETGRTNSANSKTKTTGDL
jgi:hypothetical protein